MQKGFHFQITEGPHTFLLACDDAISLHSRDRMQVDSGRGGTVTAWIEKKGIRWNAVRLGQVLGFEAGEWEQAVFMEATDPVVGIMAERVNVIENHRVGFIKPFTVVGSLAGGSSVYRGVRVGAGNPELVLDRGGLAELVAKFIAQMTTEPFSTRIIGAHRGRIAGVSQRHGERSADQNRYTPCPGQGSGCWATVYGAEFRCRWFPSRCCLV